MKTTSHTSKFIALALIALLPMSAMAGTLDPSGPPDNGTSAMYTLEDIYQRLDNGTLRAKRGFGFREPGAGPDNATGYTLDDIMHAAPAPDDVNGARPQSVMKGETFWGLRTDGTWGQQTGTYDPCTDDTDSDGTADCYDQCPDDPNKVLPSVCGCGNPEIDSDNDRTLDCYDQCAGDPLKTTPGSCGCGKIENLMDLDNDGIIFCLDICPGTIEENELCMFFGSCQRVTYVQVNSNGCGWPAFLTSASGCTGDTASCESRSQR